MTAVARSRISQSTYMRSDIPFIALLLIAASRRQALDISDWRPPAVDLLSVCTADSVSSPSPSSPAFHLSHPVETLFSFLNSTETWPRFYR
ncbi:hypothetical protein LX36DRAFT_649049 [Colletotrichum falcatum]|nr:hypothetical protein LX36DRAFT_649049 [Colletotrichum falcatum]